MYVLEKMFKINIVYFRPWFLIVDNKGELNTLSYGNCLER